MSEHTPRTASGVLADALGKVTTIQPAALQEPVRAILAAGIQDCIGTRTITDKPVALVVDLADAIVGSASDAATVTRPTTPPAP